MKKINFRNCLVKWWGEQFVTIQPVTGFLMLSFVAAIGNRQSAIGNWTRHHYLVLRIYFLITTVIGGRYTQVGGYIWAWNEQ